MSRRCVDRDDRDHAPGHRRSTTRPEPRRPRHARPGRRHITDLNDVITTQWISSFEPRPLRIIGPTGTRILVDRILDSLAPDVTYRLAHHADLTNPPPGDVRVSTAPTDHRPVEPSIADRIEHGGRAVVVAGGGDDWRALAAAHFTGRIELGDDLHGVAIP